MTRDNFGAKDRLILANLAAPRSERWGTAADRVFDRAVRDESTPFGCWRHPGSMYRGYARVYIGEVQVMAHRVAYIAAWGPIPDGLTIDHMCQTRNCVDPNHLEAVSLGENSRRHNGWATHCHAGHEYTPQNTYRWHRPGGSVERQCRTCNAIRARGTRGVSAA